MHCQNCKSPLFKRSSTKTSSFWSCSCGFTKFIIEWTNVYVKRSNKVA
jgi:uncharacterized Zn finger protein (UPF0148 family)